MWAGGEDKKIRCVNFVLDNGNCIAEINSTNDRSA